MSPGRKQLAYADDGEILHVADVDSGKTLIDFSADGVGWNQVVFSHDGKQLAAGGSCDVDIHVIVWDLETQAKLHHWKWNKRHDPHSNVEALSLSKNGKRVAAAVFRQDAAFVWDLPSDQQIAEVRHSQVYGMDIDAAGDTLVTGGWDKTIRVWDVNSGKESNSLVVAEDGEDTRMYGVKLSYDQSLIATADMTRTIRIYDRDLKPISQIPDVGSFTYGSIQFAHNDLWIAAGTRQGVSLYDVQSGSKLWSVKEHDEYIYTVDFGSSDRTILSGGTDGVCYLWDLQSAAGDNRSRDSPLDYDELYKQLVGLDGTKSFAAYQQFLQSPERASELLSNKIGEMTTRDVSNAEVSKWIVALGADDQAIVDRATNQLIQWGPEAYQQLSDTVAARESTDAKTERIIQIKRAIRRVSRLVTAILRDLDTPEAHTSINDLLKHTRSEELRSLINEAALTQGAAQAQSKVP